MITPQQFAHLLKKSTLELNEQQCLLKLLPKLSMKEIQAISAILEEDVDSFEKIIEQLQSQDERALLKMNVELGKIEFDQNKTE